MSELQNSIASSSSSSSSNPARYSLAQSVLGQDAFQRINRSRVLVVGAGGIGCELLKNLVLTGFGNIDIIDLDTIDLSNLNRQFLFQKQHIKKPKSIVAKQTASGFNPLVNIVAHHANIQEPQFDVRYFQSFDLVMNALDNLDARRWVNKMCIAADVPLIESGTTGFLGQVQPIKRGVTECYDCTEKPTPKTFPVCTIRSTPSTPIHCIVWAKSWLFTQLFGADDETEEAELDKAVADGEDATEIDNLRKEAREMRDIRASLLKAALAGDKQAIDQTAKRVFEKIYTHDIQRLLSMEEMWTHRPVKPVPLVFDEAIAGESTLNPSLNGASSVNGVSATNGNGSSAPSNGTTASSASSSSQHASNLKDQRTLSLRDNVEMFLSSLSALALRAASDPSTPLSFDKDDDEALDFVTSSSNLRSMVYSIDRKTRFEVKQMAGNIIPAIASTNAIIAGMLVLQALHVLSGQWEKTRFVSLSRGSNRMLTCWTPAKPNPQCGVCQDLYVPISISSLSSVTLEQVIDQVAKQALDLAEEDLVVYNGTKILADPDFEDNLAKSLAELGCKQGSILTVTDEDQRLQAVNLMICLEKEVKEVEGEDKIQIKMLSNVTKPQPRTLKKDPSADDDDDDDDSDEDDGIVTLTESEFKQVPLQSSSTKKRPLDTTLDQQEEQEAQKGATPSKKRLRRASSPNNNPNKKNGSNEESAIVLD